MLIEDIIHLFTLLKLPYHTIPHHTKRISSNTFSYSLPRCLNSLLCSAGEWLARKQTMQRSFVRSFFHSKRHGTPHRIKSMHDLFSSTLRFSLASGLKEIHMYVPIQSDPIPFHNHWLRAWNETKATPTMPPIHQSYATLRSLSVDVSILYFILCLAYQVHPSVFTISKPSET